MATPHDAHEHLPHALLRRPVRDIASGVEGILMAVVKENVAVGDGSVWAEIAYIRRPQGGREHTTAATNIVAAL
ncbi:hypothetical protein DEJ51_28235 [Streptomyces venezuelae]|uniref:Uncharacterized protein n=1 Tax=Streptomyces venezuelae TaxID=54571 RepID=A0A5P2DRT2_STRVZ|nr:hypothetical protein [Streptomyces venezuelae]QES57593.1 hypothetical protein DEJ51_28235 [Streptomyces venezuelae]